MSASLTVTPRQSKHKRFLYIALVVSIALHGLILAIRFVPAEIKQQYFTAPLEILLINHSDAETPKNPNARAETNSEGGGTNAATPSDLSSPLPSLPEMDETQLLPPSHARENAEEVQSQEVLMQQAQSNYQQETIAEQAQESTTAPTESGTADIDQPAEVQIKTIRARIAKNTVVIDRAKKTHIVGVNAVGDAEAGVLKAIAHKIQAESLRNPPLQGVYGKVIVSLTVLADGKLQNVSIEKSSGNAKLDEAAKKLARQSAPFAAFSPKLVAELARTGKDRMLFVRAWHFTKQGLDAKDDD